MFKPSFITTDEKRNTPRANTGLVVAAFVFITLVEALNNWQPTPLILPFLLIGVFVGARRRWPLWSLWWLGYALFLIVYTGFFVLPGPARPPIIFTLWPLILSAMVILAGLVIWRRESGFRVAFTLFPYSLEFTRFVLLDDLPVDETYRFLFIRVVSILVYAGTIIMVSRRHSGRRGWWILTVGACIHFIAAFGISYPIGLIFCLYPTFLPAFLFLAFGPLAGGLGFDCHRARHRLSTTAKIVYLAIAAFSIVGLFIPWLTGNALPSTPYAPLTARQPGPRQAIIIDTDLSHDDYVAILYLLQRSDIDVRAITVVNGVVHVEPGLENIHRMLALIDREDIPIAAGTPKPLSGNTSYPKSLRLILDSVLRLALPQSTTSTSLSASDLIRQATEDSPTPVSFIALGPLTNIAQALQNDPNLSSRLDTIIVSGGVIEVKDPSNPYATSDWNLFVDPYAADLVFRSGARLVLIPLDVTNPNGPGSILVSHSLANNLEKAKGRESQLMTRIMDGWLSVNPNMNAVPLWDAVVAAIAIDPTICTNWRDLPIRIALAPAQVAGQTIIDESIQPNVSVCLGGDQAAFESSYLTTAH